MVKYIPVFSKTVTYHYRISRCLKKNCHFQLLKCLVAYIPYLSFFDFFSSLKASFLSFFRFPRLARSFQTLPSSSLNLLFKSSRINTYTILFFCHLFLFSSSWWYIKYRISAYDSVFRFERNENKPKYRRDDFEHVNSLACHLRLWKKIKKWVVSVDVDKYNLWATIILISDQQAYVQNMVSPFK